MPEDFITRKEYEEHNRRMDDEHKRVHHRITEVHDEVKKFGAIAISVEKLALNMEMMLKEQTEQGERLEKLESRDGENWRATVKQVITVVVSAVVGYFVSKLGL